MRFHQHVLLPTIITEPGQYVTRCGQVVTVTEIINPLWRSHAAFGTYPNQVKEAWDVSGRIYPNLLSDNDIVRKAT